MYIFVNRKKIKIKENSTVLDVLKKLELNPEIYLVKRKRELITEDEKLKNNDKIELIKVISGG
ncbi:MAG: MoaD/ThiS family protein [Candidatus Aenigmatarchaeota archaeon]